MDRHPAPAPALEAAGVSHRYNGIHALRDVSLTVGGGECVALVGESGSGKTTLLRCFNGMVQPETGTVRSGSEILSADNLIRIRRSTGYVPQEGGLIPHWNVQRNVALVPRLTGAPDPQSAADEALRLVGLPPATFAQRRPSELSGGQRQRVAIARALANRPGTVLLDEPFGALDAITRAELQQAFLHLRRTLRLTALLVTHDLAEAALLADRIAVLRNGTLEQVGPPSELAGQPATDYVRDLLARARFEPS